MNKLGLAFFSVGAFYVLIGMVWGIVMGMRGDFTLAPAHAHLNLVGWATMGLMGAFYGITGRRGPIGWLNFVISALAVVVMVPCLALYLAGNKAAFPGVIVGSLLALLGVLMFLAVVLSTWREIRET